MHTCPTAGRDPTGAPANRMEEAANTAALDSTRAAHMVPPASITLVDNSSVPHLCMEVELIDMVTVVTLVANTITNILDTIIDLVCAEIAITVVKEEEIALMVGEEEVWKDETPLE